MTNVEILYGGLLLKCTIYILSVTSGNFDKLCSTFLVNKNFLLKLLVNP